MVSEIHNAHVFTDMGQYVGDYPSLHTENLPERLKHGNFVVLSEYRSKAFRTGTTAQNVNSNKIATISNGCVSIDAAEWTRNYR